MDAGQSLERAYREEATRIRAALAARTGDVGLAEDAVQDAFVEAIEHWPRDGVPPNPGGWLATTARRKALDRLRRDQAGAEKLALLAAEPTTAEDGQAGRRAAEPRVRLLPPGAAGAGAGRADAARRLRPHHRPDRVGVPGHRADDGPAPAPRPQDAAAGRRRGARARPRRARRPAGRRARRRVPRLQRGLPGQLRPRARAPRPGRAGDRADPDAAPADAARAGSARPARAAPAARVARRRQVRRLGAADPPQGPGPPPVGSGPGERGGRPARPRDGAARVRGRTRCRRRSPRCTPRRRATSRPTGGRSGCSTAGCRR